MDSPLDPGVTISETTTARNVKMRLESSGIVTERVSALKEIFPEVFTEGKVDFEKLRLALGDHVATGRERYGLTWAGKADAMRAVQIPSTATLVPVRGESVDWDTTQNVFIEGENLEVLKLLQKSYCGKVKMIYIDPPYNTGNDFIYPDDFKDSIGNYLRLTGQASVGGQRLTTNPETAGRYHSNWLSMMYPRLFLAKNLLNNEGVIFVSIDDHEVENLRCLMDEAFGEENFIGLIVWRARNFADARPMRGLSVDHEYVMVYGRHLGRLTGKRRDESKYDNPDGDPRGPWTSCSLLGKATREQRPNLHYDVVRPDTAEAFSCPPETGWICRPETFQKKAEEGRILWPRKAGGRPREKVFLFELQSGVLGFPSVVDGIFTSDGTAEMRTLFSDQVFPFPKPSLLIRDLLLQGLDAGDTVLDFFAGSGPTAQAVLDLNARDGGDRRFILVQMPEPTARPDYETISRIARERIRRVIGGLDQQDAEQLPLDGGSGVRGFRTFRLTHSNFKIWNADYLASNESAVAEQLRLHTDHVLPDRSQDDILFEILLKAGYPLTARVEPITLESQTVFAISDGNLIICLESPIRIETLRAAMARDPKPVQVICLDHAFQGNDQLKTNILLEMEAQNIQFRTV